VLGFKVDLFFLTNGQFPRFDNLNSCDLSFLFFTFVWLMVVKLVYRNVKLYTIVDVVGVLLKSEMKFFRVKCLVQFCDYVVVGLCFKAFKWCVLFLFLIVSDML